MVSLRVPEHERPVLEQLATIPSDAIAAIEKSLAQQGPTRDVSKLRTAVERFVPEPARSNLGEILELLITLNSITNSVATSTSELARGVAESESLSLDAESRSRLASSLAKLLGVSAVSLAGKAANISREYPNDFHEARIITDVRYLFSDDVEEPPAAAVISHLLRITCHDGMALKEVYFGLSGEDLAELKAAIQRAETKEGTLRSLLASSGTEVIAPPGELDA